jgi:hypothetical protein
MLGLESLPSRRATFSPRRFAGYLWCSLRALTCLCAVAGIALFMSVRHAEARLGEMLAGFGEELSGWSGLKASSAPRRLFLNGAELGLRTLTTQLSVHDALELFDHECSLRGGLRLPRALSPLRPLALPLNGVLRRETGGTGTLACFDSGGPLEIGELHERLQRFREQGDLQHLGKLRYVSARREGDKTYLLVLWTERGTALLKMFPKTGDAPGRDPSFPRPDHLRRVLGVAEASAPNGLTVYRDEASRTPYELQVSYGRSLVAGGWTIKSVTAGVLTARREGRTVLLTVTTGTSGESVATVAELG